MFPALIAGVDVLSFINGAKEEAKKPFNPSFSNAVLSQPIHVIMPYIHKLNVFTEWYSQLTAESLSKNGKGYCVLRCLGTKDQHNQLQMFIDGQDNKTYTFIGEKHENDHIIQNKISSMEIPNTRFSSVMLSGMYGVAKELSSQNKKVRIVEVTKVTPFVIGQLFVFFIKETLHQAHMLEVEPFTQPGVTATKKRMFDFLNGQ
jgi:glucose-6-phosphate isomerase